MKHKEIIPTGDDLRVKEGTIVKRKSDGYITAIMGECSDFFTLEPYGKTHINHGIKKEKIYKEFEFFGYHKDFCVSKDEIRNEIDELKNIPIPEINGEFHKKVKAQIQILKKLLGDK